MPPPSKRKLPVYINARAERDIKETYSWLAERSAQGAAKWLTGIADAIASLENHPDQHGLAPENDAFPITVRQVLYGKGRSFIWCAPKLSTFFMYGTAQGDS